MKKKFIIGICSVGSNYHAKTKKLIKQISEVIDVNFLVLTDEPSQFWGTKNVIVKYYEYKTAPYLERLFSFHDKRLIFEEGFKYENTVILIDADHCLREQLKQRLIDFDSDKIDNGAYPQVIWRYPADCSIQHFLKGLTPRVPYGKEFEQHCVNRNYKLESSLLIQESFLVIKEVPEKISNFLSVWKDLQQFCENKDIEREQHVLGYGEGYSIGVSLNTANINIIEGNSYISELASSFKHFAWERD
jgi:hypothetical protein